MWSRITKVKLLMELFLIVHGVLVSLLCTCRHHTDLRWSVGKTKSGISPFSHEWNFREKLCSSSSFCFYLCYHWIFTRFPWLCSSDVTTQELSSKCHPWKGLAGTWKMFWKWGASDPPPIFKTFSHKMDWECNDSIFFRECKEQILGRRSEWTNPAHSISYSNQIIQASLAIWLCFHFWFSHLHYEMKGYSF